MTTDITTLHTPLTTHPSSETNSTTTTTMSLSTILQVGHFRVNWTDFHTRLQTHPHEALPFINGEDGPLRWLLRHYPPPSITHAIFHHHSSSIMSSEHFVRMDESVLHQCVLFEGRSEATRLVLELDGMLARSCDRMGRVPLHLSYDLGNAEMLLGVYGGGLWCRDDCGNLPIHDAIGSLTPDLLRLFLGEGLKRENGEGGDEEEVDASDDGCYLGGGALAKNDADKTPIMIQCERIVESSRMGVGLMFLDDDAGCDIETNPKDQHQDERNTIVTLPRKRLIPLSKRTDPLRCWDKLELLVRAMASSKASGMPKEKRGLPTSNASTSLTIQGLSSKKKHQHSRSLSPSSTMSPEAYKINDYYETMVSRNGNFHLLHWLIHLQCPYEVIWQCIMKHPQQLLRRMDYSHQDQVQGKSEAHKFTPLAIAATNLTRTSRQIVELLLLEPTSPVITANSNQPGLSRKNAVAIKKKAASIHDELGRLPLHLAAISSSSPSSTSSPSTTKTSLISRLEQDANMSSTYSIQRQKAQTLDKIQSLIQSEPQALRTRDLTDHMYPFMHAATTSTFVDVSYSLLREDPSVLKTYLDE